jgi:hypothetical protein
MKLTIHGELCVSIPKCSNYVISESGRVYRIVPLTKREIKVMQDNPDLQYISKLTINYQKDKKRIKGIVGLTTDDKKRTTLDVARAVAKLFLPKPKYKINYYTLIFKDGNIKNMHYTNLKYERNYSNNMKLSHEDIKEIKKKIKQGIPLKTISNDYPVTEMQINRIKTGENWGNGKRKIPPKTAPFYIENPKMRVLIASFNNKKTKTNIKKKFYIKRDPNEPTNNQIIGIFNGYKFYKNHQNITRAIEIANKLNDHFFK